MKTHSAILAALLVSGGLASAQQQPYDSLGSSTPRPNQAVSPNTVQPHVSVPSAKPSDSEQTKASPSNAKSTTGSGAASEKPGAGAIGGDDDRTPSGLTRD